MKRIIIFSLFCLFLFLFSNCMMCDIGLSLMNSKRTYFDLYYYNEGNYRVKSVESSSSMNRYVYEKDNERARFKYYIVIAENKRSAVKLNAFKLTNLDGTPIAAKYYVTSDTNAPTYSLPDNATWQEHMEAYKKDSLSVKIESKTWDINIDSLPIVLREEGEGKAHHIRIYAETNEPYSKMKNLTIYYDFEVGEERFVSKKIKYKWRMYIDCRPKWW